jgi:hypothetical protein
MQRSHRASSRRIVGRIVAGLVLVWVSVSAAGASCDHDAQTAFRQAAVGPIGDGVRSIMDGTLDGIIAALENAGNGSSSSSTSNSTGTNTGR